jgi:hypothetical protein
MNKKRIFTIFILVMSLLFSLSVGLSAAMELGDDPPPADPANANAAVGYKIPVQGRLTNSVGVPLHGDHKLNLSIGDSPTLGLWLCGEEKTVNVDNGLFNTTIDNCTPSIVDGKQLYLGVEVDDDGQMTPRQPIYPVPYAFSLVPGAQLSGVQSGQPMLTVENFGSGGVALKAAGTGVIQSSARSFLFVPGSNLIKTGSTSTVKWLLNGSNAQITKGAGNTEPSISFPITLPAVLYGQKVRVTEIAVYYKCPDANNYIKMTNLYKTSDAFAQVDLVPEPQRDIPRKSQTATDYTISTDNAENRLSTAEGFLTLRLVLKFNSDGPVINIYGVRLTLEHE